MPPLQAWRLRARHKGEVLKLWVRFDIEKADAIAHAREAADQALTLTARPSPSLPPFSYPLLYMSP